MNYDRGVCSWHECPRRVSAMGLCGTHWRRQRLGKDMDAFIDSDHQAARLAPRKYSGCREPNCGNPNQARGLCVAHYQQKRWFDAGKGEYWESKKRPCEDCGIYYPDAMEYDHRIPSQKKFEPSRMISPDVSIPEFYREMDKFDVVCANCHRHRTAVRRRGFTCVPECLEHNFHERDFQSLLGKPFSVWPSR